jgi:hypothetical protein
MENEISLCVPKPTGKCKIPMGKRKNNFPGSSDKEKENCLSVLSPTRKTTPSVIVYRGKENPTGKNTYTVRTTHFLIKTTSFLCPFY